MPSPKRKKAQSASFNLATHYVAVIEKIDINYPDGLTQTYLPAIYPFIRIKTATTFADKINNSALDYPLAFIYNAETYQLIE